MSQPSTTSRTRRSRKAALAGILLLGAAGASIAVAQTGGAGTTVYWMNAETTSGMGSMMGGGRPNIASMMMGGGGGGAGYAHSLQLQLGSPRKATGEPNAEHVPPAALQAGSSLPLVTPRGTPGTPQSWTGQMERPKGRMLIYWGCGDRARPGQPVVLDYESMMAGKMPPAFATVTTMNGPSAARNATYGEWPNQRSRTSVPAGGSLVGEHVVRGNYTPDIRFTVSQGQDFLAPVTLTGNKAGGAGSVPLGWRPVPNARAWFVSTMGSARNGDVVLWSSSETQAMPMMMSQVSPDEINRLVQSKVLLPAGATGCTVPAEVAKAAESSVLMTTAFGPEANFSYPARPAKPPAGWRPEWTVKLLTKSANTNLLGMDMSEMMGGRSGYSSGDDDERPQQQPQQQQRRRNPLGGLGKILGQ